MKVLLCFCALVVVVLCAPAVKESDKGSVAKFTPVAKTEDHAAEEDVDLEPAEQFGFGWGGFGGRSGGWGGGWGGSGSYEGRGWGGGGWGGFGGWGGGGGWSGSNEFWG